MSAAAYATPQRGEQRLGVDDAQVTRFKDQHLERAAAVLAAAGLKVVPEDHQTLAPEYVKALQVLAVRGVENAPAPSGFGELPQP